MAGRPCARPLLTFLAQKRRRDPCTDTNCDQYAGTRHLQTTANVGRFTMHPCLNNAPSRPALRRRRGSTQRPARQTHPAPGGDQYCASSSPGGRQPSGHSGFSSWRRLSRMLTISKTAPGLPSNTSCQPAPGWGWTISTSTSRLESAHSRRLRGIVRLPAAKRGRGLLRVQRICSGPAPCGGP